MPDGRRLEAVRRLQLGQSKELAALPLEAAVSAGHVIRIEVAVDVDYLLAWDHVPLTQALPADDGLQDGWAHTGYTAALKQQPLALEPLTDGVEQVVGAGQDEPLPLADIDVFNPVVGGDRALELAGLPLLALAGANAVNNPVGQLVHGARHAVRLLKNLDGAVEGQARVPCR